MMANKTLCTRGLLNRIMDGPDFDRQCSDVPGCNPCHICEPNSPVAQLAQRALITTLPSVDKRTTKFISALSLASMPQLSATIEAPSVDLPPAVNKSSGKHTSSLTPASMSKQYTPTNAPSSDFTPAMAEEMDSIEARYFEKSKPMPLPSSDEDYGSDIFTPSMASIMDNLEESFTNGSVGQTTVVGSNRPSPATPVAGPSKFVFTL